MFRSIIQIAEQYIFERQPSARNLKVMIGRR
jgi:hypothetical protein